jgi:hypothetical protein
LHDTFIPAAKDLKGSIQVNDYEQEHFSVIFNLQCHHHNHRRLVYWLKILRPLPRI